MDFMKALANAINKGQPPIEAVISKHGGQPRIESWQGHKHFQNIGESLFDKYLPEIKADKLIIGPALYVGEDNKICLLRDCIGLYYN